MWPALAFSSCFRLWMATSWPEQRKCGARTKRESFGWIHRIHVFTWHHLLTFAGISWVTKIRSTPVLLSMDRMINPVVQLSVARSVFLSSFCFFSQVFLFRVSKVCERDILDHCGVFTTPHQRRNPETNDRNGNAAYGILMGTTCFEKERKSIVTIYYGESKLYFCQRLDQNQKVFNMEVLCWHLQTLTLEV